LIEDLLQLFSFLFDLTLVKLSLENHVLVEAFVTSHERTSEILVHHALDSCTSSIPSCLLGIRQLLFDTPKLDMVEISLYFKFILFAGIDDQRPKRFGCGTLARAEEEFGEGGFLGLGADNYGREERICRAAITSLN
jgi:hypothetical protein